jgi:hypothetical protein
VRFSGRELARSAVGGVGTIWSSLALAFSLFLRVPKYFHLILPKPARVVLLEVDDVAPDDDE